MRCVDALHDASFISFPVAMIYLNPQMPCPSWGGICVGITANLFKSITTNYRLLFKRNDIK
ncbi:hypothetical protein AOT81_10995 [Xylella fastidiosa]|nr:hypothetical protein AOT81_11315 [Xylella fastidiosa]KQH72954.1 hypothetical protein AOT81_10995 [Xylella fastidiosa]RWA43418.1 hypothetical protein XfCFBP8356_12030 [Xylella fastidiosa subsp. sandyi]